MNNEVKNGIVLGICVILIIVIVYFTTAIFMTGEIGNRSNKKTTTTSNVSSDEFDNKILASKILTQKDETYMVVIFSKKSISNELRDSIANYSGDKKLYIVNLDEPMNKYIKSNTDNLKVTDVSDLKVNSSALITITNGAITDAVRGGANIISSLK